MKVSIIVPIYNVENYLCQCIDSLIHQMYKELEIILVDDGSTDSSGSICDKYAATDNRIKVIHKENGGQSSARNRALDIATGEYVMFVDSDDYITEQAVNVFAECADRYKPDIIQGDLLNDDKLMKDPTYRKILSENVVCNAETFLEEKIATQTYDIVPVLYFVRRTLIENCKLRFAEGLFYEDQLWTLQLLSAEASVMKIRHPFYYYRMDSPGSTTNNMTLRKGQDAAKICTLMAEYIQEKPVYKREKLTQVLFLSVYQYILVWKRLKRRDRRITEKMLESSVIDMALEAEHSYLHLRKDVINYRFHRRKYEMKHDVKRVLHTLKGRIVCVK